MIEVGAICLTVLVIAWLGRGAHDLRLRERARLMALESGKQDATVAEQALTRVSGVETRVQVLEDAERNRGNAEALRRKGRL